MAENEIGWEINGRFYKHVGAAGLRHGDYALIREVTGLTIDKFDRGDDPLATETGWLAVAFWHGNAEMRRDQIVSIIEQLGADAAKRVGWNTVEDDDVVPPAVATSSPTSSTSDAPPEEIASKTEPEEQTPEPSTPPSSGPPSSATGAGSDPKTSVPSLSSVA